MMSLSQLQPLMLAKLSLASQHLPLVTQVPVWATWHIMVSLLDGQKMQLEGTLLAEWFKYYKKLQSMFLLLKLRSYVFCMLIESYDLFLCLC